MRLIIYSKDITLIDRWSQLFSNLRQCTVNTYEQLYTEATKEKSLVLMNLLDCEINLDDCIKQLVHTNSAIMLLDGYPNYEKGKHFLSIGVRGYGNLMMHDIHLQEAVNTIVDGNIWVYPAFINETINKMAIATNYPDAQSRLNILSSREKEVAALVIEGFGNQEISEQLDITLRTVKAHTKSIYEKFHVPNRLAFILLFNK